MEVNEMPISVRRAGSSDTGRIDPASNVSPYAVPKTGSEPRSEGSGGGEPGASIV